MSKPRRAPDWPKALQLTEAGPAPALADVRPAPPPHASQVTVVQLRPESITAIALGVLKDGRHAALELQVSEREVVGATLLEASSEVGRVAEAARETSYLALYRREAVHGEPLDVGALASGSAVALPLWKGKPAALAFDFEGRTVTDPKVVATGDRLFAWDSLETWMAVNMLPRERKR